MLSKLCCLCSGILFVVVGAVMIAFAVPDPDLQMTEGATPRIQLVLQHPLGSIPEDSEARVGFRCNLTAEKPKY